jgi:hypothetical protein
VHRTGPGCLAATAALIVLAGCTASAPAGQPSATSAAAGRPTARPATQAPSVASATAAQLSAGRWSALRRAPITPRGDASVVWTGRELLVWGGDSGSQGEKLHADGAAYNPRTGRWRRLPAAPLDARTGQAAAWTGTEMIIWGGYDQVSARHFRVTGSGAAYDPATNKWQLLPKAPLSPRANAIAVWTGRTLVLLGGQPAVLTNTIRGYRDGASFSPGRNRWQRIAPPVPPHGHPLTWNTAVPSDGRLLAWSEWETARRSGPNTGADAGGVDMFTYNQVTGQWRLVPPAHGMLPDVEEVLPAGHLVVVRGLTYNCGLCPGPFVPEATDLYNPGTNTWTRLPADPLGGDNLVSGWTGAALISLDAGGQYGNVRPGDASVYSIAARRWRRLPAAPFGCETQQPAAWTGRQLLLYCPRPPAGRGAGHDGLALTISRGRPPSAAGQDMNSPAG